MVADEVITGITVCHNTKDFIERAHMSVRQFHPNMQIIIIDGSDKTDSCYTYVDRLANDKTRIFHASTNVGHGRGICYAITNVKTPFVLIFDSDIEMLKSPVQAMLDMMEDDTYGVGYTEKTAFDGHEWGANPIHAKQGWMRMLHPCFCLIQLKEYGKYNPFIHHGAPAVNTCLDIHRRGLSDKVIKDFPGLGHSSGKGFVWEGKPREFIKHDPAGTRNHRKSKGLEEIEGTWEKVVDPGIRGGGITCITCTGDRPLAFSLCERWMKNQIMQPNQWVIVDDGRIPSNKPNLDIVNYIYRAPKSNDPKHTMILNLEEAIKHITNEKIIIIEDDEYYSPTYISEMSKRLDQYELVGIGRSKYYYLPEFKYYQHDTFGHASLAQTGFRKSFLSEIIKILAGDSFLDVRLWEIVNGANAARQALPKTITENISNNKRGLIFDDRENSLYVGMKGLPGRVGIGSGHGNHGWYALDINRTVLKSWIPKEEDFQIYLNLLKK
jgi:hypothetical protein